MSTTTTRLLAAFRWIMATYTASGADGPAPFPWCDNYTGNIAGISFDPDEAVAAIDSIIQTEREKELEQALRMVSTELTILVPYLTGAHKTNIEAVAKFVKEIAHE